MTPNKEWMWNDQVESFREPNVTYCRDCDALIDGYDHVCPWTGRDKGEGEGEGEGQG